MLFFHHTKGWYEKKRFFWKDGYLVLEKVHELVKFLPCGAKRAFFYKTATDEAFL